MSRSADGSAVILLYHRIATAGVATSDLQVHVDDFRRHLHHVTQTYTVISLDRIVAGIAEKKLPPRSVAITFDDGYLENLQVIAPIVREFDVPVTFFVTTAGLAQPLENWWDVIERVMTSNHSLPPHLDLFGDGTLTAPTDTAAAREGALRALTANFFQRGVADRQRALLALIRWSGLALAPRESHRVLMTEELQALARMPGVSIGAHSVHHPAFTRLESDEREREAVLSKRTLEEILSGPVTGFAYPYGDCDAAAAATVRSAGFRYAVTVRPGASTPDDDLWLLPRCEVAGDVGHDFERWLAAQFVPH